MSRLVARRPPKKLGGFSWGRFPVGDAGVVAYRLFRRDHRGALHTSTLHFCPRDQRREVALALRQACRRLRDRVDEIALAAMGVAA